MIEALIIILLLCWAFGLAGGYAFGGVIHLLLVLALVAIVYRLWTGRRPPL